MNVAIIGLGLIGGSFAKAFKQNSNSTVFGYDRDASAISYAKLSETINDVVTEDTLSECDLVIIALYPDDAIEFMNKNAKTFKKDALVIDACGTKQKVCKAGFEIAKENGFVFVGGHPMAGIQFSGIKYSRADLFVGASMIIVPPCNDDIRLFDRIKTALAPVGFGKLTVTTAKRHDEIIAYTSQLAHVVSNAYIKSETAGTHHGFSAGSYKDMTRVATLNENMWTQLFMENKENLSRELGNLIGELSKYKKALDENDKDGMMELLREGRECKERADG